MQGSPYTAKITKETYGAIYGAVSEVPLKINEAHLMSLNCTLRAPSGHESSSQIKRLSNGNLGVIFTPREYGEYMIDVKKDKKHIQFSPFFVNVHDDEKYFDCSKVKVYGDGIGRFVQTMGESQFFVNTRYCGFGGLGLSIEGPSKVLLFPFSNFSIFHSHNQKYYCTRGSMLC